MKTKFHAYQFDTRKPGERADYAALVARLTAEKLAVFCTWGGKSHYMPALDGLEITLETSSLFDNQWNTAPIPGISDTGYRVFDWAEDYPIGGLSPSIKRGHYLDVTPEMREIRRNTMKCRYCGAHEPAAKGYVFCPHCPGSAYLKASDLPLTRMKAIDDKSECAPLTEAERSHILPIYREAQLHGHTARDKARIVKARADIEQKCTRGTINLRKERDGFIWLMDRGINTENVIYYSHTGKFSFGWRTPVDAEYLAALLDVISEFPFAYEIKCADGRTLNGD